MPGFDEKQEQAGARRKQRAKVYVEPSVSEPVGAGSLREPVTLVKGGHRWTFACDAGDEAELLRRVTELARGEDVPFDWFDAALVTHQLSKRLKAGLYRIDGNSAGTAV